jgi:NAD(P)-dependent dehydrogenase (short-subunit alcohol dehydrogenase family)
VEAFRAGGSEVIGIDIVATSDADEHLVLDLSRPDCGQRLLDHLGGRSVDVLVNNAAMSHAIEASVTSVDQFDRVMSVNLRAPFLLSVALLPTLRERSGSIVNVSSVHAVATSAPVSVYAASKGGLVALTRALALEWAPRVRVNCVLPGAVDTGMLTDGLARAGQDLDGFGARVALGRVAQPDEIANAIVFMATNTYLTGASLIVDGGASTRLSTE